MIIKHRGIAPQIDPTAYVAPTATVVGNVEIGAKAKVMFGAIINSEGSKINIGENAIISENAVIRATAEGNKDHSVKIGDNVFIGPHATILGANIEPCSYIASSATILQGAKINSGSVVTVGALIQANTIIPEDFFVPPNMIAVGDPVQLLSSNQKEETGKAIMSIGFANVAFNIDVSGKSRAEIYRETTLVRSKEYEAHFEDQIIKKNERHNNATAPDRESGGVAKR